MIGMFDCCGKRHDGAPEVLRAATRLRFAPGARQRVPCLGSQALLCVPFLCRFPPLALTHPPHAHERGRTPSRAHRKRRCDTLHATRGLSAAWVSRKSARPCTRRCGPRDSPALHRAGIVFASDGTGGLIVKGFVPKSTAAQCGRILEGDLLVQVCARL